MSTNNKISNLINSQVPFFVRNDHQTFVSFLEAYYEYLEQSNTTLQFGKTTERAKNFLNYIDIDKTLNEFADKLYDRFLYLNINTQADKKLILKHVQDFYRAKGSEKAYRFLMRAMFGEEVEFYYPKVDVLKASDGKWYIQRSLRVTDVRIANTSNSNFSGIQKFTSTKVTGQSSDAFGIVERVERFSEQGTQVDELVLSGIKGVFENGEQVRATFTDDFDNTVKTITANVRGGSIESILITNPGSAYKVGDHVYVTGEGAGACVVVGRVSTGNVPAVRVISGGAGYQNGNFLLITGGGGSGANAEVDAVNLDGLVHPTSYNVVIDLISQEQSTNILNSNVVGAAISSRFETYAYRNLKTISTISSNLTISTGTGNATEINLSFWKSNSNTFFETFDQLNVGPTSANTFNIVTILSSNTVTSRLTVTPSIPGGLVANSFAVIKKANVNTTLANGLSTFVYGNTGPARLISVNSPGIDYGSNPDLSILANTRILELGILGRLNVTSSGTLYSNSDFITFNNVPGGYGSGARANLIVNATGSIIRTEWAPVQGQIIGGSGYDENFLPTASIQTSTGSGGAVEVVSLLGSGATMQAANSTIGAILRLDILNKGSDYVTAVLDFTANGDGTATGTAVVAGGVITYPGRYLNDDGHISAYNFLQDRDYYQNHSYVLRLKRSIDDYRQVVKDFLHPAGMKLWGQYELESNYHDYEPDTVQSFDSTEVVFKNGTYNSVNGNVTVTLTSHGQSIGSNVYIEFTSGNIDTDTSNVANISNGAFRVVNLINADAFGIVHYSSQANTNGSAYVGVVVT